MRRLKRRGPSKLTIGVIGAIGAILLTYLVFSKDVPLLNSRYTVKAVMPNSGQLVSGFSPVRIAGVTVGKVVGFEKGDPTKDGPTRVVELELRDEALPLHTDATVKIRPRLFLEGGFYVQLEPGTPGAPELPDGGTIPISNVTLPVQIDQILSSLRRPVRDDFRSLIEEFDTALDKGGAESLQRLAKPLAPTLRDLAIVSQAARGTEEHDLSEVVKYTSRVTAALASRDDQLADLVTNLNTTTGAFASQSAALAAGLRELDGVMREAPPAFAAADKVLPILTNFTRELRPALPIAPAVLKSTAKLLPQLEALARPEELRRTIRLLRPVLRALPRLERRLTVLFPRVTPVSDCLREKAIPVLESPVNDGALSTGKPVWQDLAHGLVGFGSMAQNYDANGPLARYLIGAGANTVSLGELLGNAIEPIQGSRPTPLPVGTLPPFRPDAECRDQPAVNLGARTGGGPLTASRRMPRSPQLEAPTLQALKRLVRQASDEAGRR